MKSLEPITYEHKVNKAPAGRQHTHDKRDEHLDDPKHTSTIRSVEDNLTLPCAFCCMPLSEYPTSVATGHSKQNTENEFVALPFVNLAGAVAGGIPFGVRRGLEAELIPPPLPRLAHPPRFQAPIGTGSTYQQEQVVIT